MATAIQCRHKVVGTDQSAYLKQMKKIYKVRHDIFTRASDPTKPAFYIPPIVDCKTNDGVVAMTAVEKGDELLFFRELWRQCN